MTQLFGVCGGVCSGVYLCMRVCAAPSKCSFSECKPKAMSHCLPLANASCLLYVEQGSGKMGRAEREATN